MKKKSPLAPKGYLNFQPIYFQGLAGSLRKYVHKYVLPSYWPGVLFQVAAKQVGVNFHQLYPQNQQLSSWSKITVRIPMFSNWMFSVDSSPPPHSWPTFPKVSRSPVTMLGTPDAAVSPKFLRNCHGGNYRNHKNDQQRGEKKLQ